MCEFCDDNEYKEFVVPFRNTYAEDNMCEKIMKDNCEGCNGCKDENFHFSIYRFEDFVCLGFRRQIDDIIVSASSERLIINYCPMCGRALKE